MRKIGPALTMDGHVSLLFQSAWLKTTDPLAGQSAGCSSVLSRQWSASGGRRGLMVPSHLLGPQALPPQVSQLLPCLWPYD